MNEAISKAKNIVTDWQSPFLDARKRRLILITIVLIGAALRISMCFIGYPHLLHSDEKNVVEPALDLIRNETYLAYVYYHPDQLQIKICAVLFELYSNIRYGVSATELGSAASFYVIARMTTAICGVATIPVVHCIGERVFKASGVFVAFIVAFFPLYITHSSYAAPDVPLTLIFAILIYMALRYIQKDSMALAVGMGVMVGVGMVTKYPAAIGSVFVIIVCLFVGVRGKDVKRSVIRILVAAAVAAVMVIAIAPNLLTDFSNVLATVRNEARTTHAGSDGLGFFGNLWYYLVTFFDVPRSITNDTPYMCWEIMIPIVIGAAVIVAKRAWMLLPFSLSAILWIFLSFFGLHWTRWALAMYIAPLIVAGIGLYAMAALARHSIVNRSRSALPIQICAYAAILVAVSIGFNAFVSSLALSKSALVQQTRVAALEFCEENGITAENSVYDGYSPLYLAGPLYSIESFSDPASLILEDGEGVRYVVTSSYMSDRYSEGDEEYEENEAYYTALEERCTKVGSWEATRIDQSGLALLNAFAKVAYLLTPADECLSGPDIAIYELPEGE